MTDRENLDAPRTDAPSQGVAGDELQGEQLLEQVGEAFGELGAYVLLTYWGWRSVVLTLHSDVDPPNAGKEFGTTRIAFAWRHNRVAFSDAGDVHQFFDTTTALRVTRDVLHELWDGTPRMDPELRDALEGMGQFMGNALQRFAAAMSGAPPTAPADSRR